MRGRHDGGDQQARLARLGLPSPPTSRRPTRQDVPHLAKRVGIAVPLPQLLRQRHAAPQVAQRARGVTCAGTGRNGLNKGCNEAGGRTGLGTGSGST